MAEFLRAVGRRNRYDRGFHLGHGAYRGALQQLRRSPRSRLRGRPAAHRTAVLHQWRGVEVRAEVNPKPQIPNPKSKKSQRGTERWDLGFGIWGLGFAQPAN